MCDFVEVLDGYGGAVLDPNNSKKVVVNSPEGVAALTEMVSWVGTISPISITTYTEEACRQAFQNGDATFMRNWPYAYSLGNDPPSQRLRASLISLPFPMVEAAPSGIPVSVVGIWQSMPSPRIQMQRGVL